MCKMTVYLAKQDICPSFFRMEEYQIKKGIINPKLVNVINWAVTGKLMDLLPLHQSHWLVKQTRGWLATHKMKQRWRSREAFFSKKQMGNQRYGSIRVVMRRFLNQEWQNGQMTGCVQWWLNSWIRKSYEHTSKERPKDENIYIKDSKKRRKGAIQMNRRNEQTLTIWETREQKWVQTIK